MIVENYYENPHILHENTMPDRSYYVPASVNCDEFTLEREKSDRFLLLNGQWSFKYYKSIYDVRDKFFLSSFDKTRFDYIKVPSTWQSEGYDSHQYTNVRYPIPFDPPYVPNDNPCGAYICDFKYEKDDNLPLSYLIFEGVDSCFYVWLNGAYVGYSQVSHSTHEFDISQFLRQGNNRLSVLVLKWCDGSYMEDQDKFRQSGIFNDVYIIKRPSNFVYDYFIRTKRIGDSAEISVDLTYLKNVMPTDVSIKDAAGNVIKTKKVPTKNAVETKKVSDGKAIETKDATAGNESCQKTSLTFKIKNPKLWSAETPYLYRIEITTDDERITDRIGIRDICIKDKVVLFNDTPIVFDGVNRHDSDPVTGFTISKEQMIKDMTIMKRHNFNAIRSSHYPNAPYFYQLCDEFGFYVICEADNESHGPCEIYYKNDSYEYKASRWNETLADNPEYAGAILDRVKRMVMREKNRPCIIIWSMGNESAYGICFEEALKWTKSYDSSRLTHYESARYHGDKRKYDFSNLDLYSRMYPSLDEIKNYLNDNPDKPMILCEYCHAMGNGPGDLEDYYRLFKSEKLLCGGFVWEFCDHAVYKGKDESGKDIYYYGGDHNEDVHDSNFCMDGLVYPDRRLHTGIYEHKNVHRPIRVTDFRMNKSEIDLVNNLNFTDAKDYISINYELTVDGVIVGSGKLDTPSILPHETATILLPLADMISEANTSKGKAYLRLIYTATKDKALVPEGYELGFDEIALNAPCIYTPAKEAFEKFGHVKTKLNYEKDEKYIEITGEDFTYRIDRLNGMFTSIVVKGYEYLDRPARINIWRAPTDNDMYVKSEWYRARFDHTYSRAYETICNKSKNTVIVNVHSSVLADTVQRILDIRMIYKIDSEGRIKILMSAKKGEEFPDLPRFGLRFFLKEELPFVTYYGMGPYESYRDKNKSSYHGLFESSVADMHEDYIKPQENGSRYDCDYVKLSGEDKCIKAVAKKSFSFNASYFSQEELTEKKHNYELEKSGSTIFCIDYAQNGIGSNSCGPDLLKEYAFDEKTFEFEVIIIPGDK